MPKSGSAANAQGKVVAAAIVASLGGKAPAAPALFNICYSLVTPDYGISVTDVYQVSADKGITPTPNAGGVSVKTPTALNERKLEAEYTVNWYKSITADVWA
jgi:sulfide dehydrogenase [flavocytochrome c] flavoprotein subunit